MPCYPIPTGALAPWLTEVTLACAALGSIVVALITRETKQMFRWTEIKLLILAVIQQLSQPNSYSTIRCKQTKKRVNESKKKKVWNAKRWKGDKKAIHEQMHNCLDAKSNSTSKTSRDFELHVFNVSCHDTRNTEKFSWKVVIPTPSSTPLSSSTNLFQWDILASSVPKARVGHNCCPWQSS